MTLMRLNPVKEFENLTSNLQRYFEDFPTFGLNYEENILPRMDIMEDDKSIVMETEIPGMKKNDIKISVEDKVLKIEGEKKREEEKKEKNYYRAERLFGKFERSFVLPDTIDTDKIDAEFEDGVLKINLKKVEAKKPETKEIKVK